MRVALAPLTDVPILAAVPIILIVQTPVIDTQIRNVFPLVNTAYKVRVITEVAFEFPFGSPLVVKEESFDSLMLFVS